MRPNPSSAHHFSHYFFRGIFILSLATTLFFSNKSFATNKIIRETLPIPYGASDCAEIIYLSEISEQFELLAFFPLPIALSMYSDIPGFSTAMLQTKLEFITGVFTVRKNFPVEKEIQDLNELSLWLRKVARRETVWNDGDLSYNFDLILETAQKLLSIHGLTTQLQKSTVAPEARFGNSNALAILHDGHLVSVYDPIAEFVGMEKRELEEERKALVDVFRMRVKKEKQFPATRGLPKMFEAERDFLIESYQKKRDLLMQTRLKRGEILGIPNHIISLRELKLERMIRRLQNSTLEKKGVSRNSTSVFIHHSGDAAPTRYRL